MKIIATGISGLVGTRIVELNPDVEFINVSLESGVSILDPVQLESVFTTHPDASLVLHLAAFTDTNAAWAQNGDKSGLCYQLNVVGTQNIVNLCQKYGKNLIHISTDYVFDGQKSGLYTESDTPHPLDWYSETKYLAEQIIPPQFTIVRLAFPYRANFDTKIDLVRKIMAKLKNGETCKLFSDQFTTPTFIDDIAFGLAKVFVTPKPGIYHLVASSTQSVYQMGQAIATTFGFDQNLIQPSLLADYLKTDGARPYAPNLSLSNQKFIADFGYTPNTLTEGLVDMKLQLDHV